MLEGYRGPEDQDKSHNLPSVDQIVRHKEQKVYLDAQMELIRRTTRPGEDIDERAMAWATGDDAIKYEEAFGAVSSRHSDILGEWDADQEAIVEELYAEMFGGKRRAA